MIGFGKAAATVVSIALAATVVFLILGRTTAAGMSLSAALMAITALLVELRRQVRTVSRQVRDTTAALRRSTDELAPVRPRLAGLDAKVTAGVDELGRLARAVEAVQEHHSARNLTLDTIAGAVRGVYEQIRELLYVTRMLPQDLEAQRRLQELVQSRASMPVAGGWGLDARTLLTLVSLVRRERPARVMELGSGLSTIWLGYVQQQHGGTLISVEHLDDFAQDARRAVTDHGLEGTVDVRLSPLRDADLAGETWCWYDVTVIHDLDQVDLLLVDGPPKSVGPLSRYPAMPLLLPVLADEAWIVLDDARRPDEREVLRRWLEENADLRLVKTSSDDIALLHYRRTTHPTT